MEDQELVILKQAQRIRHLEEENARRQREAARLQVDLKALLDEREDVILSEEKYQALSLGSMMDMTRGELERQLMEAQNLVRQMHVQNLTFSRKLADADAEAARLRKSNLRVQSLEQENARLKALGEKSHIENLEAKGDLSSKQRLLNEVMLENDKLRALLEDTKNRYRMLEMEAADTESKNKILSSGFQVEDTVMTANIGVSCRSLVSSNGGLTVDPIVLMFMKVPGGKFVYVSQTEPQKGSRSPDFEQEIQLRDVSASTEAQLKFSVYHVLDGDINENGRVGSAVISVKDLFNSRGSAISIKLVHKNPTRNIALNSADSSIIFKTTMTSGASKQNDIQRLQSELKDATLWVKEERARGRAFELEKLDYKHKFEAAEERVATLQSRLEELTKITNKFTSLVSDKESTVMMMKALREAADEKDSRNAKLTAENMSLHSALDEHAQEISNLTTQRSRESKEKAMMLEQLAEAGDKMALIGQLITHLGKTKARLDELEAKHGESNQAGRLKDRMLRDHMGEVQSLASEKAMAQTMLDQANQEIKELTVNLELADVRSRKAESAAKEWESEYLKSATTIADLRGALKHSMTQVQQEFQQQNAAKDAFIEQLREQNEELRKGKQRGQSAEYMDGSGGAGGAGGDSGLRYEFEKVQAAMEAQKNTIARLQQASREFPVKLLASERERDEALEKWSKALQDVQELKRDLRQRNAEYADAERTVTNLNQLLDNMTKKQFELSQKHSREADALDRPDPEKLNAIETERVNIALRERVTALEERLAQADEEYQSLKVSEARLLRETQQLKREVMTKENQLRNVQGTQAMIVSQVEDSADQIDQMFKHFVSRVNSRIGGLSARLPQLQATLRKGGAQLGLKISPKESVDKRVLALQMVVDSKDVVEKQRDELRMRLEALKEQYDKIKTTSQLRIKKLTAQHEVLAEQQRIADERLLKETASHRAKIKALQRENAALRFRMTQKVPFNLEVDEKYARGLTADLDALKAKLVEKDEQLDKLKKRIKTVRDVNLRLNKGGGTQLLEQLREKDEEAQGLRRRINELESLNSKLQSAAVQAEESESRAQILEQKLEEILSFKQGAGSTRRNTGSPPPRSS